MAAHALEPDADVVPTGHAAHALEPAFAANVPDGQKSHAPATRPRARLYRARRDAPATHPRARARDRSLTVTHTRMSEIVVVFMRDAHRTRAL